MSKEYDYCKIVQDLLPSYIEKVTDEETNKFVEEHINICDKCKKMYNDLLHSFEDNEKTKIKKEVKYMKKYKNKMTVLKTILLTILAVVIIYIGRNMIIIGSLQSKANKYTDMTNYHIEWYSYEPDGIEITEIYMQDDEYLQKNGDYNIEEGFSGNITYANKVTGSRVYFLDVKAYGETEEYIEPWMNMEAINYINTQNDILRFIWMSITARISTVECNGRECYKIDDLGVTTYVDKETGLTVRVLNVSATVTEDRKESSVFDIFYEVNTVTDEDLEAPDKSEFEKVDFSYDPS